MSDLLFDKHSDGTAILTINRPSFHNAFNETLIADMTAALIDIDHDKDIRLLILSANGKSFSAGADLNWMKKVAIFSEDENIEDATKLAELMSTLNNLSKPTIARVQGAAYGGGIGLIACCDIAIATESASFALSEVKLGLIPAVISPYVIAAIGERQARRYFLTAESFNAMEAHRIGLVHMISPDETSMDVMIHSIISAMLKTSPIAQHEAKLLIRRVGNANIDDDLIKDTVKRIARVRISEEGKEGINAFLEKRNPRWVMDNQS